MSFKGLTLSNGGNIRLTYVPSSEPELISELQNWSINEAINQATACNREINNSVQEAFSRSLKKYKNVNKENDDILIPIAVPILKKLLSPFNTSNNNNEKETILSDIKENLDLSAEAYKKLKRILFSQDSLEISDFPSPDIPKVSRNTAPPRLITTRRKKYNSNKNKENVDQTKKDPKVINPVVVNRKKLRTPNKFLNIEEKNKVVRKPLLPQNKEKNKEIENNERGSSALFHTKKKDTKIKEKPGIVCTHFLPTDLKAIYEIVKKLGQFEIENDVTERTTHVIYDDNSRTVNLYRAIIRGCWILSKKWVYDSMEEKRWLYEERYERTDSSQFLKIARINRQKLGFMYSFDILKNQGPFYVSPSCKSPNSRDLENLILLCGGRITKNVTRAKMVIGLVPKHDMNVEERWILQCIWNYELLDVHNFLIK